ncbi:hypothetical protein KAR91_27060, partial [Candidatus Pacearchaeota archaeon]|nr:hypothetical protein [Candidatus Pacearchaeota archaeon]
PMFSNIVTRSVIWLMRNTKFSMENRNACTIALLDKLNAIPSHDIINVDATGQIYFNRKPVDADKMSQLRSQADDLINHPLRQLVREQVQFRAVKVGIHKGETAEQTLFARAAIWQADQEDEIYEQIAHK